MAKFNTKTGKWCCNKAKKKFVRIVGSLALLKDKIIFVTLLTIWKENDIFQAPGFAINKKILNPKTKQK